MLVFGLPEGFLGVGWERGEGLCVVIKANQPRTIPPTQTAGPVCIASPLHLGA